MRKGTSGALLLLFDCPMHFASSTQCVIALSSAEGDVCAFGTGTGEALHARPCLTDTKLLNKLNIVLETDSPSGLLWPLWQRRGDMTHTQLRYLCILELSRGGHETSQGVRTSIQRRLLSRPIQRPHDVCQDRCSSETRTEST